MPTANVAPDLSLYYEDEYFGPPWLAPESILLIHGVAESSLAWHAWVPVLGRELRVLRPDLRGFGRTSVPPADYDWTVQGLAADLAALLDHLGLDQVHVVGAKFGGTAAMQFAASFPERTRTLTVVSGIAQARDTLGGRIELGGIAPRIREVGVRQWAAETMRARLGEEAPEEQVAWWTDYMASANRDTCLGVTGAAGGLDIWAELPRIQAPTLVVTTDRSPLAPLEAVRAWQRRIPRSELLVLPSDSYHIAAVRPEECARFALEFIRRQHA